MKALAIIANFYFSMLIYWIAIYVLLLNKSHNAGYIFVTFLWLVGVISSSIALWQFLGKFEDIKRGN